MNLTADTSLARESLKRKYLHITFLWSKPNHQTEVFLCFFLIIIIIFLSDLSWVCNMSAMVFGSESRDSPIMSVCFLLDVNKLYRTSALSTYNILSFRCLD